MNVELCGMFLSNCNILGQNRFHFLFFVIPLNSTFIKNIYLDKIMPRAENQFQHAIAATAIQILGQKIAQGSFKCTTFMTLFCNLALARLPSLAFYSPLPKHIYHPITAIFTFQLESHIILCGKHYLRGKHCWHPIAVMGVIDTFEL